MKNTLIHFGMAMLVCWATSVGCGELAAADNLDFNRDIRPILSDKCFACHGPDAAHVEGDLRIDLRDIATKANALGEAAIVPGKPEASELVRRINADDADERMPPAESNKTLLPAERKMLARWITEGAEYKQHWSFAAPIRAPVPEVQEGSSRVRNPIDAFIAQRLKKEGMSMSPAADRATLIRRVSLDLTGLPPTPVEVEAFLNDKRQNAYEFLVDRLLASSRYAERMTMLWLDLARFADTHGYNNDGQSTQWPWRDWVIHAFDVNMPYDQFIIEQLAGDLLEGATAQQRLATAFNRNHVISSEGGIIQEEYRVEYVADRVHTTSTVFLGLSLQCARCHDHKFDPITQRDYYRFFAFFNNVPESMLGYGGKIVAAAPSLQATSPLHLAEVERVDHQIAAIEDRRKSRDAEIDGLMAAWELEVASAQPTANRPAGLLAHLTLDESTGTIVQDSMEPSRTGAIIGSAKWAAGKLVQALEFDGRTYVDLGQLVEFEHDRPFSISAWVYPTANQPITVVSKMDDSNAYRGFDLIIEQGRPGMHLVHHFPSNYIKTLAKRPLKLGAWHHLLATYDGSSRAEGVTIYVDGVATPLTASGDNLSKTLKTDKPVHLGRRSASVPFHGRIDDVQFFSISLSGDDAKHLANDQPLMSLVEIIAIDAKQRTPAQQDFLRRFYLENVNETYHAETAKLADLITQQTELKKTFPPTMVMQEMPKPRQAFVLTRGEYDKPGDPVAAGVPVSLPPLPEDALPNRLALARWMVDPANPLTARVTVNRWWQTYFGTGIVETVEDFGSQGAWPTHPELLDWLATELVASGWNVKAMQKLIVMSAAYRQSSHVTPELLERDPKNQLLARGPRYRLPAETVRDNALAVSGLLVEKIGGPSVYPYQPSGLWKDVSVSRSVVYKPQQGENLYRRSMYTFWKRTCPPPAMSAFDAPDRETCLVRRATTNTPLQALVLMNDPTYVEAARTLAERILLEGGDSDQAKLDHAYQLVVARRSRAEEQQTLLPLVAIAAERFRASPEMAEQLLNVGDSPRNTTLDPATLASWTTIASILLNLDETISKQ